MRAAGECLPASVGPLFIQSSLRSSDVDRGLGLDGDALDVRPQLAQALVDPLVAAVDLADVADFAAALRAQRRQQHRHPRADVRRLDALAAQASRTGDDRAVRI